MLFVCNAAAAVSADGDLVSFGKVLVDWSVL